MKTAVHFSTASDDWPTPQDFFNKMSFQYGPFDLDVCASFENAKCEKFYDQSTDGLTQTWGGGVG